MSWNYDPKNTVIPEGTYRARIDEVTEEISKSSNNEMAKIKVYIIGKGTMYYYIVYDHQNPERTNSKFKTVYKHFGIPEGTDISEWAGALGAVCVKNRQSNFDGSDEAFIAYFTSPDKVTEQSDPEPSMSGPGLEGEDEIFSIGDMTEADFPI
jgi:hypothetical protein